VPIRKWNQEAIVEAALKEEERRMALAVQVVIGNTKRLLNRGNPKGNNPSLPGEPPKKVSARLFNSIAGRVTRVALQVVGVIGTDVKYARRLEKGFVGKDSAGRTIDQKPRPFLAPGLAMSMTKVKKILGSK
jgi:hypothetical protein